MVMSAFLLRFKANYLRKMHGYPYFSFWIPIAFAKRSTFCAWSQFGTKTPYLVGTVLKTLKVHKIIWIFLYLSMPWSQVSTAFCLVSTVATVGVAEMTVWASISQDTVFSTLSPQDWDSGPTWLNRSSVMFDVTGYKTVRKTNELPNTFLFYCKKCSHSFHRITMIHSAA